MTRVLVLTVQGSDGSRRLEDGMSLTIGRGAGSGWVLPDTAPKLTLSRQHCRFTVGADGASVTDLGSANGTKVDGYAIDPHTSVPLRGGEMIELGPYCVLAELLDAGERVPDSPVLPIDDIASPWERVTQPVRPGGPAAPLKEPPEDRARSTLSVTPVRPAPVQGRFDKDPLTDDFGGTQSPLPVARRAEEAKPRAGMPAGPQSEAMLPPQSPFMPMRPMRERARLVEDPLVDHPSLTGKDTAASTDIADSAPTETEEPSEEAASNADQDSFGLPELNKWSGPPFTSVDVSSTDTTAAQLEASLEGQPLFEAGAITDVASPAPADTATTKLLAAFLEGADQPPTVIEGRNPEAFLRDAGQVFAFLADGLRVLLAVRTTIKEHARLDRTQIAAAANNPLKLSVNSREATAALLGRGEEGYLPPRATVQASFRDLKAHELAVVEGLQSAVDELLRLFEPAVLEANLADAGTLAVLLQGGRRARLWELYQERYDEIARSARTNFLGHVNDAFRQGYARKAREASVHVGPLAGKLS